MGSGEAKGYRATLDSLLEGNSGSNQGILSFLIPTVLSVYEGIDMGLYLVRILKDEISTFL